MTRNVRALIRYRMEQAEEALSDAATLLRKRSFRTTMSRAYYAMFYSVLALLQTRGLGTSKHGGAIGLFDSEFVRSGEFDKQSSKWLHKAFSQRQKSDYDELVVVERAESVQALEIARRFVSLVKAYLSTHTGAFRAEQ